MRYIPTQVVFVLNRVQRRLTQARPGSVLIMVVVLVVLLALMGTALLTTTRGDRYVSSQNTANTQIDLLVDGVVQQVKSAIVDDLYGTVNNQRAYRPAWDSGTISNASLTTGAYMHWDMPNIKPDDPAATPPYVAADHPQDMWLAPRLPSIVETGPKQAKNLYWLSISMLPGVTHFDAPFACNSTTALVHSINPAIPSTYTNRLSYANGLLTPHYVRPRGYSQSFPAWFFVADPTAGSPDRFVVAADADGDGIADSGYVKIPVGELDGLTYYYSVRVVDNSSAVNVNTAWSRTYDLETPIATGTFTSSNLRDGFGNQWTDTTTNNLGAFRSHVGLYELMHYDPTVTTPGGSLQLQADSEIGYVNAYRFNNGSATTGFADGAAVAKEATGATPRTDFIYATQGDFLEHTLARRLDNAGTRVDASSALVQMKPFSVSDAASLAYHFPLSSLDVSGGIESTFDRSNSPTNTVPDSVHRGASNYPLATNKSPVKNRRTYPPSAVADWMFDNFNWSHWTPADFGVQNQEFKVTQGGRSSLADYYSSLRPILTTYNPVSMLIPQRDPTIPPAVLPAMPDYGAKYTPTPPAVRRLGTKTDINTAKFEELWRAFWYVMSASNGDSPFTALNGATETGQGMEFNQTDFSPMSTLNPQRMFRSSIRDALGSVNRATILSRDMVQLRAAAAAVQAMQMRQVPDAAKGKAPYSPPTNIRTEGGYDVKMFGTTPQPFITEVYVWYDAKSTDVSGQHKNVAPYIAIELYNPFSYDVDISNLKIKYWHREAGVPTKTLMDTGISFTSHLIKPNGFVVIDNFGGGENDGVQYYPPSSKITGTFPNGLVQGDGYYSRPGDLDAVLDNEMIITRTRTAETEEQPVDSFDFSGFPNKDSGETTQACAWHYVRRTTGGTQGNGHWGCVYPGRYDMSASKGFDPTTPRQQGTEYVQWEAGTTDPWDGAGPTKAQVTLGDDNDPPASPAVHEFIVPLPDKGSPGPNGLETGVHKFPFGMFARDGDMLQVPFIASYVVRQGGVIREINSISMDAAFAEDTDTTDDIPSSTGGMREQIGHFCPIAMSASASSTSGTIDDFNDDQTATTIPLQRYAWARKLFDYLTVQSPASDYTPDVSPDLYTGAGGTRPEPVKNSSANAAEEDGLLNSTGDTTANPPGNEDAVPVQGLININTAPWIVLSAIPWVPAGQDKFSFDVVNKHFTATGNQVDDNIDIAKAIAYWRDGEPTSNINVAKGPFRSAFDLYKVADTTGTRVFQLIQNTMFGTTKEPGFADGEISSFTAGDPNSKDGVRDDFKEQYLLMTKVSNLITTRSDSFTVYILVQGWRGVGGNHPELVVQRRVAFIQDRSPITCTNTVLPSSVNVPTD